MSLDDDLALLKVSLTAQQAQLQKELEASLLDSSGSIPLGSSSATQGLEDLSLNTGDELDDTVISAHVSVGDSDAQGSVVQASGVGDTGPQAVSASKPLERQNALLGVQGRSKEEKAKNGTRQSLAFLNRMAKRDMASLTRREKLLIRKHRQSVAKFERTYGPASVLLGAVVPSCFIAKGASPLESTGAASSIRGEVGDAKVGVAKTNGRGEEKLRASVRAVSKPVNTVSTSKAVKGEGMLKASARATSKPGTIVGADKKDVPSSSGPVHSGNVKRVRSGEEQPRSSKRTKKSESLESKVSILQVAVIDRNDPDGRISPELWQQIERRLLEQIAGYGRGKQDDISFLGADWNRGVKVVNCGNRKSIDFLSAAVGRCGDLCPEAKLDVICSSCLPLRPVVTVWIPPPVPTVESILSILTNQNGTLDTSQWKPLTSLACKGNEGRDFRFAIDRKSLEHLNKTGGRVNFGLGGVRFRFIKNDKAQETTGGADKSAPQ